MNSKWKKVVNKTILSTALAAAVFGGEALLSPSKTFAATGIYKTVISAVNVRTGAGTDYKVITTLSKGTNVEVLAKINEYWFKVKAGEITGYISTSEKYTESTPSSPQTSVYRTLTAAVNVRTGPGTSYSVIELLRAGITVEVVKQVNDYWYEVKLDNKIGYMSTSGSYSVPYVAPIPTPEPVPVEEVTWSKKAAAIISYGEQYLGAPYVFGAGRDNDKAFDCSGFVYWVYTHNGVEMTRSGSKEMASLGTVVEKNDVQIGDLIFSDTNGDGIINHVSIYAGEGKVLHTYKTGVGVTYSSYVPGSFYYEHTIVAKRVLNH